MNDVDARAEDSIPRLVERDLSFPVVRNVSLFFQALRSNLIELFSERIAIARALLRNPKVLLLDEVCFSVLGIE